MLDQIFERHNFGDLDGALDFVDPLDAVGLRVIGDVDVGVRTGATPVFVGIHGRMQGVEFEFGIAEPVAEFGDLGGVAPVEMLFGAEYFNGGDVGALHAKPRPGGGQPVIDDDVRGEGAIHFLLSRFLLSRRKVAQA